LPVDQPVPQGQFLIEQPLEAHRARLAMTRR
jgi:hypothetical protein